MGTNTCQIDIYVFFCSKNYTTFSSVLEGKKRFCKQNVFVSNFLFVFDLTRPVFVVQKQSIRQIDRRWMDIYIISLFAYYKTDRWHFKYLGVTTFIYFGKTQYLSFCIESVWNMTATLRNSILMID